MRRRILQALVPVLVIFAAAAAVAVVFIRISINDLSHLVTLHEIEVLRRGLVENVRAVQTNLYAAHTDLSPRFESVLADVTVLRRAAAQCSSCHHRPEVVRDLEQIGSLVGDYERTLGYYLTASGSPEALDRLKADAAEIGGQLVAAAEEASARASARLEPRTRQALAMAGRVQVVIVAALAAAVLLGTALSMHLAAAITRPVAALVEATRKIRAGRFGQPIEVVGAAELSELARNFEAMSASLAESYRELRRSENALKASNEQYELAAQGANDGLWDWDVGLDRLMVSPRWLRMMGLDEGSPAVRRLDHWLERVCPEDAAGLRRAIDAHLSGELPHFQAEYRTRDEGGAQRWMMSRGLAVRGADGRAYRMAGSLTDVTQRKMHEERLRHHAMHDPLTGLPNRVLLEERLSQVAARAGRHEGHLFGVLFLDLDRFKSINDTYGHDVGDRLLVAVGQRLSEMIRTEDVVGRMGGDEFVVILDGTDGHQAITAAERIRDQLERPFSIDGQELSISVSVGIAFSTSDFESPRDLLRYADIAMYRAKPGRGPGIGVFENGSDAVTLKRAELEADLGAAAKRGELRLQYQPILSLGDGRICGLEALVRWQHPRHGLLHPDSFLPLAERNGTIGPIGRWVLGEAFRDMRSLQRRFGPAAPGFISVNLSSKQLAEDDLVAEIARLLEATGLDPGAVRLEITETSLAEKTAAARLSELRELGVQLFLDDFGTGYSSLGYLDQFPIHALKIDRSFVKNMREERRTPEIVRAIVGLAKRLRIQVVAEGIESHQQLAQTRALACEYAQGDLISKPLELGELETLLAGPWSPPPESPPAHQRRQQS